jgi:hypothetical protein
MDIEKWRLPNQVDPKPKAVAPRPKRGELFLRGPIPWSWLSRAAKLPGKALQVALVIWLLSALLKGAAVVVMSPIRLRELGVQRHAGYRGLRALEKAGLVSVERGHGKAPRVTICEPAFSTIHPSE